MPSDRTNDGAWGISTLPCDRYPDLRVRSTKTFAELTDLRAHDLCSVLDANDFPIVVCWSGGIDSTVILSALVKNWPKNLLDRIQVRMNRASYYENPWFFDKIILKHGFKIQHEPSDWHRCYVLTGNCADQIWIQADIVELQLVSPESSRWCIYKQKDNLLRWIAHKSNEIVAQGIYDLTIQSSQTAGVQLDTVEDFYWWWNFNFVYTGQLYKYLDDYESRQSKIDISLWQKQHLSWYHTDQYQLWSAWNRSNGTKIANTVRSYKWPAKQYIFDVDGNQWYRDYKTKLGSGRRTGNRVRIKGLYEDGSLVL
jgi:hypothetical protein